MVDLVLSTGQLLLALFLVVLNGFFVASEFALVRIRSTAVDRLVEEGRPGSGALRTAVDNLDDYLATTQLGITIASLGLGWVGEPAVAALLEPVLEPVLPAGALHLVAFAIGFSTITFLHVVFGELAPKTIAIQRAERLSLLIAPPMRLFYYLFVPGIVVFNGTANAFTKLLGVEPASETEETLDEEELLLILSRSGRQGQIDRGEVEMIEQVFELDDMTARTVLVPRPDVVSVHPDTTLAELRDLVGEEGHTRYPVIDEEDDIHGFVDVKDVLTAVDPEEDWESMTAADVVRDLTVVPETVAVDELLARLQEEQNQMAAVIDEWGAMEGIVTVEDLIEEVVGEIHDEFDSPAGEPSITRITDGSYAIDGGVPIAQVNDDLDAAFDPGGTETIGGLVLDHLGRAPEVGDRVETDGFAIEVTDVDGTRISQVIARRRDSGAETAAGEP
ncbi:MAG: cobalt transporter [Halobacteriales archaeon SW_8_66_22]|nr:MAG: cobalt transporter [Halobacteriales archaeon SW_8_66_22]